MSNRFEDQARTWQCKRVARATVTDVDKFLHDIVVGTQQSIESFSNSRTTDPGQLKFKNDLLLRLTAFQAAQFRMATGIRDWYMRQSDDGFPSCSRR